MWNKSNVLLVRVRAGKRHDHHRRHGFAIPLSLFALQEALDALEPLVRLCKPLRPRDRAARQWKHLGGEYLEVGSRFLRELRGYGRMDIVDVQARDGSVVKVSLY